MAVCPHCGSEMVEGADFCTICFKKVDEAVEYQQPIQEVYEFEPQQQSNGEYMGEPVKVYMGEDVYQEKPQGFSQEVMTPRVEKYPPAEYTQYNIVEQRNSTLELIIKIFLILACVLMAFSVIGLFWAIPLTAIVFTRFKNKQPVSLGLSIAILLLVSRVAGICLIILNKDNY